MTRRPGGTRECFLALSSWKGQGSAGGPTLGMVQSHCRPAVSLENATSFAEPATLHRLINNYTTVWGPQSRFSFLWEFQTFPIILNCLTEPAFGGDDNHYHVTITGIGLARSSDPSCVPGASCLTTVPWFSHLQNWGNDRCSLRGGGEAWGEAVRKAPDAASTQ